MSHARTAETGAPQNSTKSPVVASSASVRGTGPSLVPPSSRSTSAPTIAMWPPDTATRCATPHAANTLSIPALAMASFEPHTLPASIARAAERSGSMAASATSLLSFTQARGPDAGVTSSACTTLTVPHTPCRSDMSLHSPVSLLNLPTARIRVPMSYRSSLRTHTSPRRAPPRHTWARARYPLVPSDASAHTSSSHDETALRSSARAVPSATPTCAEARQAQMPHVPAASTTRDIAAVAREALPMPRAASAIAATHAATTAHGRPMRSRSASTTCDVALHAHSR